MAELSFHVEDVPEVPRASLVKVSGAIDAKTVLSFQEQLEELQKGGNNRFILDMDGIKYVNSTGLGTLVNVADNLENAGGGIALVKIHPKVKVVFDMLGLNAFFKIFETKEEAMGFFGVAPKGSAPASAPAQSHVEQLVAEPVVEEPTARRNPDGTYLVTVEGVNLTVPKPGTYKNPRTQQLFRLLADGRVEFVNPVSRPPAQPLQMKLSCVDYVTEGLVEFVRVLARRNGFADPVINMIQAAVQDTCRTIIQQAYDSPDNQSYNVVIIPAPDEIKIQISDSGRFLSGNGNYFQHARSTMDSFDHRQSPKGGNLVSMAKKCG